MGRGKALGLCTGWFTRAGPRDVVAGGGTKSRSLEPSGESREGEYEMGDEPPVIREFRGAFHGKFFKIYVSENAFQAILKPIFSIFYNLNFK